MKHWLLTTLVVLLGMSGSLTDSQAQGYTLAFTFGAYGSGSGQFIFPVDALPAPNGDIFVSDYSNDRIEVFDRNGYYLREFGSTGTGNGQFSHNGPAGMAFDHDGRLLVTDYFGGRVQRFSTNGVYLSQFGSSGYGNGQFSSPDGIAVDSTGDIIVCDRYNYRIEKFDAGGNFLLAFGSRGANQGQFDQAECIAVDAQDNIYVADTVNHRVQIFDSQGRFLSQFDTIYEVEGIAVDKDGHIFVADYHISEYDRNGNLLVRFGADNYFGLHIDGAGNLYATSYFSNTVSVFRPTNGYTASGVTISDISPTSATISWNTSFAGDSLVQYGVTASYGSSSRSRAMQTQHRVTLTNLLPNTVYHVRVGSTSAAGATFQSGDSAFVTAPSGNSSIISNVYVVQGGVSYGNPYAVIRWHTDKPSSSVVQYSDNGSAAYNASQSNADLVTDHLVCLPRLSAASLYHYRVRSANASGEAVSGDFTFVSGPFDFTLFPGTALPRILGATATRNGGNINVSVTVQNYGPELLNTVETGATLNAVQPNLPGIGSKPQVASNSSATFTFTFPGTAAASGVSVPLVMVIREGSRYVQGGLYAYYLPVYYLTMP